jgi:hypothetical protein
LSSKISTDFIYHISELENVNGMEFKLQDIYDNTVRRGTVSPTQFCPPKEQEQFELLVDV